MVLPPLEPSRARTARRPRIGLVIDAVENEYQWGLIGATQTAARDAGALLFVLAGGAVSAEATRPKGEEVLYDFVAPTSLDAVMLSSGTIGHQVGPEGLADWSKRFAPLPVASVGLEVPGLPSFVVDNESGTHRATLHLAERHGHRRIAFVQGAAGSREATARQAGYERGLAEAGLPLDPRLIVPGDFTVAGGRAAVGHLLDRERIVVGSLNAIVAANDALAFGVIEELDRRDIRVPGQIAVIGFDDVMLARVGPPPLTTLRQPMDRLATATVRELMSALRGAPSRGSVLETELVVRRSCGCLAAATTTGEATTGMRSASEVALLSRRDQIAARLARTARGTMVGAGTGWEERLLVALVEDARGGGMHLATAIDGLLARLTRIGTDPEVLDDVLSTLRAEANAGLECGPALRRVEDAFHDARRLLHDQLLRLRMRQRAELALGLQALGSIGLTLRSGDDAVSATENFVEQARVLGCDAGLVAWLEGDGQTARSLVQYDRGGLRRPQRFPIERLWPGEDPDTTTGALLLHSILDGASPIGFCAFSPGAVDGGLHGVLRELVAFRLRRGPSLASVPAAPREGGAGSTA